MTEKEIRLEFTLTEDEFVQFQSEFMKHGWRRWLMPAMFLLVMLSFTVPFVTKLHPTTDDLIFFGIVTVVTALMFLVGPRLLNGFIFRRLYRKQPGISRAQKLTASETGVAVATDLGSGESRWAMFTELVELRSFYYLKF